MTKSAYDIHLVCGATGAGKSAYAIRLAQDLRGIRFSIDEWMQRLHYQDKPEAPTFEWHYDRVQRNCFQMRKMAEQLVPIGVPCIIDCGLINKQERDVFVNWAKEQGFSTQLHFVDVPTDVRWQRVQKRNAEQAETFQFEVTRYMFDFIDSIWQPPDDAEITTLNGIRITD
ncbi:MAG: ATP-binding protein [Rhodobacteraceae bacterium]|nr:ATP-binding protein [Paracoccaceae bacterium]